MSIVEEVRTIATNVDWPCEVKTLFRETNLGCKNAVGEAITWFFEHEEQGIILEDDCLPSQSFFGFCNQLLNFYEDNEEVFMISGYNSQQQWRAQKEDYFFSNLGGIWGWASWRRAWKHYDSEMVGLDERVETGYFRELLGDKLGGLRERQLVAAKGQIDKGQIDTWAYPWGYSRHLKGGIACVPAVSLISNIGFGPDATHTVGRHFSGVRALNLSLPVKININSVADVRYDLKFLGSGRVWMRVAKKIWRMWRSG
jgi:hypothetical protein